MANSSRQLKALMSDIDGIYGLWGLVRLSRLSGFVALSVQICDPPTTSG